MSTIRGIDVANAKLPRRFLPHVAVSRTQEQMQSTQQSGRVIAWIILASIFVPSTLALYLGAEKITLARIALLLLFFPAIARMVKAKYQRHFVISDLSVCAMSAWMIAAGSLDPTGTAEAVEFLGFYFIARAYLFGPSALVAFIQVFTITVALIILLAVLDPLSGHFFINDAMGYLFKTTTILSHREIEHFYRTLSGVTMLRATSTLDHPIMFGAFCCISLAVIVYSQISLFYKLFLSCFCVFGCIISWSSAPLLGCAIVMATFCYDRLLARFASRWKALVGIFISLFLVLYVSTDHPIPWLILHFTLDPETGYYRILIWDSAFTQIPLSPFIGFGVLHKFDLEILDTSVDSVWLVQTLNYGIPMAIMLLLSNITAFWEFRRRSAEGMQKISTSFTLVLLLFIILGFTVHFWYSMWQFWAVCIGIRASLKEHYCHVRPPTQHLANTR